MSDDQSIRIAVAFAREVARTPRARLCTACVEVLGVTGAGITMMAGEQSGPICVSDTRFAALEDLQFITGEGPCQDAYRTRASVHAPHMDDVAFGRWPGFVPLARTTGVGGVFAYPLAAAGAQVGVLTLYQQIPGGLSAAQHADSLAVAQVLTETVLSLQAEAPPGDLDDAFEDVIAHRAEVHQASGMMSVQLGIPVSDALVRLRAYAYAHDRNLPDVAADVVARRLQFHDEQTGSDGQG